MKLALRDLGSVCPSSAVQGWTTCPHLPLLPAVVEGLIPEAAFMEQLTLITVTERLGLHCVSLRTILE